MLLKKNMLMKLELEVVLLSRILYILRGIPKELSRILNKVNVVERAFAIPSDFGV